MAVAGHSPQKMAEGGDSEMEVVAADDGRIDELRRQLPVALLLEECDSVTPAMQETIEEYRKRFIHLRDVIFGTGKAIEICFGGTPEITQHAEAIQILFRDVQLFMERMGKHSASVQNLVTCVALKYIQDGGQFPSGDAAIGVAMDNAAVSAVADHELMNLVIDMPIKDDMLL